MIRARYPVYAAQAGQRPPRLWVLVWGTTVLPEERHSVWERSGESDEAYVERAQARAFEIHGRDRFTRGVCILCDYYPPDAPCSDEYENECQRLRHVLRAPGVPGMKRVEAARGLAELRGFYPIDLQ